MKNYIILSGIIKCIFPISQTKKLQTPVLSLILVNECEGKKSQFEIVFFKTVALLAAKMLKENDLIKINGSLIQKHYYKEKVKVSKTYIQAFSYEIHTKG